MNFLTIAIWLAGACTVFLGAEAQLITPGNTVEYVAIIGHMIYTSVELHRAALDVDITAFGALILTAQYGYYVFIRNLDGIHAGLIEVNDALQPLTTDITALAASADQQNVLRSDLNKVSNDIENLGTAISHLCSYIEDLFTGRAQQTQGTTTVDDTTADVNTVAASVDNLITAIYILKEANYPLFQFFFCGAVFVSDLCGATHHAARALEDLALVITYKVQALAATDPDAVTKIQNLSAALRNLASKLRDVCTALIESCVILL